MKVLTYLLVILLVACSTTPTLTVEPASTSTLIPPTSTLTPVPPTVTPTTGNLPGPQDLATAILNVTPESTPEVTDSTSLIERDPIAAELVRLAQNQVAALTDLAIRRIQLVEITPMVWTDSSLNCPRPDNVYLPVTTDGYRIVLETGDQEYLFHTDIDRVVPCDPEDEQLPEN